MAESKNQTSAEDLLEWVIVLLVERSHEACGKTWYHPDVMLKQIALEIRGKIDALPAVEDKVLDTNSVEFGQLIRRRGALISKKNRQGLNDEEWTEYRRLEKILDATMERRFPPPNATTTTEE